MCEEIRTLGAAVAMASGGVLGIIAGLLRANGELAIVLGAAAGLAVVGSVVILLAALRA